MKDPFINDRPEFNVIYLRSERLTVILSDFFNQLWCYYHKKTDSFDFPFWSNYLDSYGVNWSVQNKIACSAEKVENQHIYFRTLLKNLGIDLYLLELEKWRNEKNDSSKHN